MKQFTAIFYRVGQKHEVKFEAVSTAQALRLIKTLGANEVILIKETK